MRKQRAAGTFSRHVAIGIVTVLIGVLITGSSAFATTYYVATNGNDSNPGTQSSPWRTLKQATMVLQAGDTVLVADGNYVGFWGRNSGTADNRIVYKANGNNVIIDTELDGSEDHVGFYQTDYNTIDGFIIDGAIRRGIAPGETRGLIIKNCTIRNCGFGAVGGGIQGPQNVDIQVIDNFIYNNGDETFDKGLYLSAGGSVGEPLVGMVIRGNVLYGNTTANIQIYSQVSGYAITGAIIEDNICYGSTNFAGFHFGGLQNSIIRNNVVYNNHSGEIKFFNSMPNTPATGNVIVNNTVIGREAKGIWFASNSYGVPSNNVVFNNIVVGEGYSGLIYDQSGGDNFVDPTSNIQISFTDSNAQSLMNDLFVDQLNDNYVINPGSAAHDAGVLSYRGYDAPGKDINGEARPSGGGYDIGAYEISESQQTFDLSTPVVGSGEVTRIPNKLSYFEGEVVTLEAIPDAGWMFTTWSGDKTGTANPTALTINGAMTVTANFEVEPTAPPVIPTNIDAEENPPGCADVSWRANTESDLAGYVVYFSPLSVEQGAAASYLDSVQVGISTSTQICGFAAGPRFFAVRAFNTSGQYSGYSSEIRLDIVGPDVTGPVIVTGSPGDGAVDVDPGTPTITFVVSDAHTGVNANAVNVLINGIQPASKNFIGNASSYTVECTPTGGLPTNATVTVNITADDLAVPPNQSTYEYSFTTGSAIPPTTPSALVVEENTLGCADVSWEPNTESDLSGYVLYYGPLSVEQGGATVYADSVTVGMATSRRICGFSQGTQFFAVRAVNRFGQYSGYSAEKHLDIVGPDLTAPVILVGSPGEGAVDVDPRTTSIFLVISDSHSGVDTNSVDVSIAGVEPASITFSGDPSGYAVVCEPAGGLPSNATVTVEVSVSDLASPSNQVSDQWSFSTAGIPPSIPVGLSADGGIDGCAHLSWDENSEPDIIGYTVYYGTESVAMGQASDYADSISVGNETTVNICGLADGGYYFAVRVKNESGLVSGLSAEAAAEVSNIDLQGPMAPQQVQVSENTPGCVTVSWQPNTESNLDGYVVYYGSQSVAQGETTVYTDSVNVGKATATEICGLAEGIFFVALRAYSTTGLYSDYSTEKLIDVAGPDTDPPVVLVASPADGASGVPQNTDVLFVLSDSHTGVDTNSVSVSIGGRTPSYIAFNGDPSRYAVVCRLSEDLPSNSLINVSVGARDRASSPNQVARNWFFTTGSLRPNSPTGLVALGDDSGRASLTWNANPENNIVGYTIYFGMASVAQGQTAAYQDSVNVGPVTSQIIGGLLDGRYYFALRAKNSTGVLSGFSAEVWTDVLNLESEGPIPPQQVQPTETSPGCVTVTWQNHPDPNVAGFMVYHRPIWSISGESEYVDSVDVGDATSGVICGLEQGMYFFAVKAYDQLGTYSGFSTEKHAEVIGLDTEGPTVLVGGPLNGAVNVRPTATIFFVVSDGQTGVDTNTVNVLINGEAPAKTTFTGDPSAFAVVCEPSGRLPLNSLVSIEVGVSDLSSPGNRTQVGWDFTTSDGRPSPPTGLMAEGTDNGCSRLGWNANTEEDVAGYRIYYGTASVELGDASVYADSITVGTISNRTICGLSDGRYYFAIRAWTDTGLMSGMSAEASTYVTNGDAQSPLPPTAVAVSETSPGCVNVEWAANSEPDIAGYVVYYGTRSVDGGEASDYDDWVDVGDKQEYDVCGLTHGVYFVALRAYNTTGGYSGYSDEYEAYVIGEDVDGPTIIAANPVDGATDVPLNSSVFFAISDTQTGVDKNTVSVTINGAAPDSLSFNGNNGHFAVVCSNDEDFDATTAVTVEVTVADLSDPPNETTLSWSFTTGTGTDTTPPETVSQTPASGEIDVDPDSPITIRFRDEGGFGIASIEFFVNGTSVVDTTVTGESNGDVSIVYNNTDGFAPGSTVEVLVVATDVANNTTSIEFSFAVAELAAAGDDDVAIVPDGYWAHDRTRPLKIHNLPSGWTVRIFSTAGSEVRSYRNSNSDGADWVWDFSNDHGRRVAKSLYLIKVLDTGGSVRKSGRFVVQSDS